MITAKQVQELRTTTGAGMMECKKALEATNGDIEAAVDWLREKGIAKAEKKATRIAAEGLANIYANDTKAVILEINSETDFVSKNAEFKAMLDEIGSAILNSDAKIMEEALDLKIGSETIAEYITSKITKIGEKLSFRRFDVITKNADETFGTYLHMGGKIAVLTKVKGSLEVAKDIAMQTAAMKPRYIFESDMTEEDIAKEKQVLKEQAMNEGKPADIAEKMVIGRLKKFYQENCLIDQEFIKDSSMNIKTYLENNHSELINVIRYEVGEGLEHRCDNFADEVMKQVNETK